MNTRRTQVCQTEDDGDESSSTGRRRPAGRPVCARDGGQIQHGPGFHQLHGHRSEPFHTAVSMTTVTTSQRT